MARKKISEYTAKSLLLKELDIPYLGIKIDSKDKNVEEQVKNVFKNQLLVVKVDEGVKGRMKKGLVKLKVEAQEVMKAVNELSKKGYTKFLVEEFLPHLPNQERYFAIERTREGKLIHFSDKGGIEIENNQDAVLKDYITQENLAKIADFLNLKQEIFQKIISVFDELYFSFLEVNPLVIVNNNFYFLDLAVEVDSSAEFFVKDKWTAKDFVEETFQEKTQEEKHILDLKAKSQAAFKLDILNPDGSIWMLLSGGGASIVLADEVYNQGRGLELANYGEYSGNPNQEETYIYTKNLLKLLLKSKAARKVLIIGGGVANFTDIKATFKGVIRALDEVKDQLYSQKIKIFVRRGGPNQKNGLAEMKEFLQKANILGGVWDPSLVLSDIIIKAIEYLNYV